MSSNQFNLPEELQAELVGLMREVDGECEITDMKAFMELILQHANEHPGLLDLIKLKEGALEEHYERTGEVPPGVKLVRTTREEGSNVIGVEVLRGPIPPTK